MKNYLFSMAVLLGMAVSAHAMSYEQARDQALFLADKMAYELNLTEEQYEACYEVNLDYFMGINNQHDLYGEYWTRRNADLNYILFDWQYRMFVEASYFYRPLYWEGGFWHFGIYARYPYRDYFYFGRPDFVVIYRGGHAWHRHGGHSWYSGRDWGHHRTEHHINNHSGMRDGYNSGKYGRGGEGGHTSTGHRQSASSSHGNRGTESMGNGRVQSSTRSSVATRGNMQRGESSRGSQSRGELGGDRTFSGGSRAAGMRQNGSAANQSGAAGRMQTRRSDNQATVQRGAGSFSNHSAERSSGTSSMNRSFDRSSSSSHSMSRSSGSAPSMSRSMGSSSSMSRSSGSAPSMSRSMGSSSSMSRSMGSSSMGHSAGGHSMGGGHSGGGGHGGGHMGGGRR